MPKDESVRPRLGFPCGAGASLPPHTIHCAIMVADLLPPTIDTDTDTNTNTDTKTARASTEGKVLTARLTNAQKAMQFSVAYASGRCVHHPPHSLSLWEALAHHFLMRLARPVDG
jgi:hypothetical protein